MLFKYIDPPFVFRNGQLVETELVSRVANHYTGTEEQSGGLLELLRAAGTPVQKVPKCFRSNKNFAFVKPWAYFLSMDSFIVRFSVEDPEFKEEVLEYENVEDFLVDDKLTITFLTSAGLLRQVRPTDTAFRENSVDLKQQNDDVTYWTALIDLPRKGCVASLWKFQVKKNRFILVGPPKADSSREVLDSVEVPSTQSRMKSIDPRPTHPFYEGDCQTQSTVHCGH